MLKNSKKKAFSPVECSEYHSPFGSIDLVFFQDKLCFLQFKNHTSQKIEEIFSDIEKKPLVLILQKQFDLYFSGKKVNLDFPLFVSGTDFQKQVWSTLQQIQYGEVRSYRWVAESIQNPLAARAVGQANGRNSIPLFIPCHRIVTSDHLLGGFAYGVELKRKLLELEGVEIG